MTDDFYWCWDQYPEADNREEQHGSWNAEQVALDHAKAHAEEGLPIHVIKYDKYDRMAEFQVYELDGRRNLVPAGEKIICR